MQYGERCRARGPANGVSLWSATPISMAQRRASSVLMVPRASSPISKSPSGLERGQRIRPPRLPNFFPRRPGNSRQTPNYNFTMTPRKCKYLLCLLVDWAYAHLANQSYYLVGLTRGQGLSQRACGADGGTAPWHRIAFRLLLFCCSRPIDTAGGACTIQVGTYFTPETEVAQNVESQEIPARSPRSSGL